MVVKKPTMRVVPAAKIEIDAECRADHAAEDAQPACPDGDRAILAVEEILKEKGGVLADLAFDAAASHQRNRGKRMNQRRAPTMPGMMAQVKPPQI